MIEEEINARIAAIRPRISKMVEAQFNGVALHDAYHLVSGEDQLVRNAAEHYFKNTQSFTQVSIPEWKRLSRSRCTPPNSFLSSSKMTTTPVTNSQVSLIGTWEPLPQQSVQKIEESQRNSYVSRLVHRSVLRAEARRQLRTQNRWTRLVTDIHFRHTVVYPKLLAQLQKLEAQLKTSIGNSYASAPVAAEAG